MVPQGWAKGYLGAFALELKLRGRLLGRDCVQDGLECCQVPVVNPTRDEAMVYDEKPGDWQYKADAGALPGFLARIHDNVILAALVEDFHLRDGAVRAVDKWLQEVADRVAAGQWRPRLVVIIDVSMQVLA